MSIDDKRYAMKMLDETTDEIARKRSEYSELSKEEWDEIIEYRKSVSRHIRTTDKLRREIVSELKSLSKQTLLGEFLGAPLSTVSSLLTAEDSLVSQVGSKEFAALHILLEGEESALHLFQSRVAKYLEVSLDDKPSKADMRYISQSRIGLIVKEYIISSMTTSEVKELVSDSGGEVVQVSKFDFYFFI